MEHRPIALLKGLGVGAFSRRWFGAPSYIYPYILYKSVNFCVNLRSSADKPFFYDFILNVSLTSQKNPNIQSSLTKIFAYINSFPPITL